ncbi:MAG: metalloregulator ArsR/SmtB family transcription factor [Verrucomicrobia bacterium]|nr:metalloregulator ArsR/SmtB family transcription factor [Verrucomicrobiota bacterium]
MKIRNYEVFNLHAELCKVMSSPKRLMIIDMLSRRDMSVGEIAESLETQPATVSQHLRLLRDKHLVNTRKEGQTVYYSLALPRMMDACRLVREILIESLKKTGALADDFDVSSLIEDVRPEKSTPVQSGG